MTDYSKKSSHVSTFEVGVCSLAIHPACVGRNVGISGVANAEHKRKVNLLAPRRKLLSESINCNPLIARQIILDRTTSRSRESANDCGKQRIVSASWKKADLKEKSSWMKRILVGAATEGKTWRGGKKRCFVFPGAQER